MANILDENTVRAEASEWVARRQDGHHGAADQRAFLLWLNGSDEHRRAYAEAEALWNQMRDLDLVADVQMAQARKFLRRRRTPSARRRVAIAAAVALAVGGLWLADLQSHLGDVSYRTALGQRRVIDLADGSRLELNTDSEAAVHYSRRTREVRLLRGQAVFTVVHDHDRPFDVWAGSGRIRDIGTQFEVRQWPDRISVAVLDGEVEVTPASDRPPARLGRGQSVSYGSTGDLSAPHDVDTNTHAAWREGRIVFHDQPLREVLQELARYHSGSIAVGAASLMDIRVSGSVPTDDLQQALRTVAAGLPARLRQSGSQAWRLDPR